MKSGFRSFSYLAFSLFILAGIAWLASNNGRRIVPTAAASGPAGSAAPADADPYCEPARDGRMTLERAAWWGTPTGVDQVLGKVAPRPPRVIFRPANAATQTFNVGIGPSVGFEPDDITINAGDTVKWTWFAGPHTLTSGNINTCTANAIFCAPNNTNCGSAPGLDSPTVYSRVFNQAGVFTYYCRIHCAGGMWGKVTVNAVQIRPTPNDFDGDGKADLVVFRPSDSVWYQLKSIGNTYAAQQFGASGDLIAPADFDGDAKTDITVFRPGVGGWYYLQSSNGAFRASTFGQNGDIPVATDFDGDGKADLAVFRPAGGAWYILQSSSNTLRAVGFGANGDRPLIADFDADSKSDVAVFRPSTAAWYYLQSSDASFHAAGFGALGDKPVPGDFDGDGKTDLAVYRPAEGNWYSLQSTAGFRAVNFGLSTDVPAPGDYDGDGKIDVGVYRNGSWYQLLSSNGSLRAVQFGSAGDIPAPAANIP